MANLTCYITNQFNSHLSISLCISIPSNLNKLNFSLNKLNKLWTSYQRLLAEYFCLISNLNIPFNSKLKSHRNGILMSHLTSQL